MGACFQAPRAAPGQRPMETLLCLTFLSFHHFPQYHQHCNMLEFNVDGLFGTCHNISQGQGERKNKISFGSGNE